MSSAVVCDELVKNVGLRGPGCVSAGEGGVIKGGVLLHIGLRVS